MKVAKFLGSLFIKKDKEGRVVGGAIISFLSFLFYEIFK